MSILREIKQCVGSDEPCPFGERGVDHRMIYCHHPRWSTEHCREINEGAKVLSDCPLLGMGLIITYKLDFNTKLSMK